MESREVEQVLAVLEEIALENSDYGIFWDRHNGWCYTTRMGFTHSMTFMNHDLLCEILEKYGLPMHDLCKEFLENSAEETESC